MQSCEQRAAVLEQIIEERRSIRQFTNDPVPEADLLRIIRAAGWAPSAGNQQMWHFIVIRSKEIMQQMQKAILDAVDEMLSWEVTRGNPSYEDRVKAIPRSSTFFINAPVTVAVLNKPYDTLLDTHILPARGFSWEEICRRRGDPGRQSLGAAVQNFLLMASALGYGTCWVIASLCAYQDIERILKVEEPWRLAAIIPLGIPAHAPAPRPRKPVEEIRTFID